MALLDVIGMVSNVIIWIGVRMLANQAKLEGTATLLRAGYPVLLLSGRMPFRAKGTNGARRIHSTGAPGLEGGSFHSRKLLALAFSTCGEDNGCLHGVIKDRAERRVRSYRQNFATAEEGELTAQKTRAWRGKLSMTLQNTLYWSRTCLKKQAALRRSCVDSGRLSATTSSPTTGRAATNTSESRGGETPGEVSVVEKSKGGYGGSRIQGLNDQIDVTDHVTPWRKRRLKGLRRRNAKLSRDALTNEHGARRRTGSHERSSRQQTTTISTNTSILKAPCPNTLSKLGPRRGRTGRGVD